MSKILFVDDDQKYQSVITKLLEVEGYTVETVSDPVIGVDLFKENRYDLVISDLVMDTVDGLQFVSIVKRINPNVPIIILTGHDDPRKEVQGLDLEIDDYIYKPTPIDVLLKRISKSLRMKKVDKNIETLASESEDIVMNLKNRKVTKDGKSYSLTMKEFGLLSFFLKNKNIVFTREEMLDEVWGVGSDLIDTRTIDTHVKLLRSKLGIYSINSVRGIGYEWFE